MEKRLYDEYITNGYISTVPSGMIIPLIYNNTQQKQTSVRGFLVLKHSIDNIPVPMSARHVEAWKLYNRYQQSDFGYLKTNPSVSKTDYNGTNHTATINLPTIADWINYYIAIIREVYKNTKETADYYRFLISQYSANDDITAIKRCLYDAFVYLKTQRHEIRILSLKDVQKAREQKRAQHKIAPKIIKNNRMYVLVTKDGRELLSDDCEEGTSEWDKNGYEYVLYAVGKAGEKKWCRVGTRVNNVKVLGSEATPMVSWSSNNVYNRKK